MTDGSEPDPDRPDPHRPHAARPAPEGSAPEGSAPDGSAGARPFRVVRFDELGTPDAARTVRVAAFGELDGGAAPAAPVTSLEDLVRRRERPSPAARPTDDRVGRSAPPAAERTTGAARRRRPDGGPAAGTPLGGSPPAPSDDRIPPAPSDDGIPPDRPLPRGRRRGARRARVGHLGPDAPGPDEPRPPADPVAVAREICLRLLADRARTRQELAQALARKGVPDEAVATVLDRFDEVGLIDDAAFAEQWVRSRHAHRGLGRRAIAEELRRKGVADDVAGAALAAVDTGAEASRARELVDRKLRSLRIDTPEQRTAAARRLVGMLARRGYGAGTAYGVVRDALAEHGADADELGADAPDD